MRFQRASGYFYSGETPRSHTDTPLDVQKGSAEHGDTFRKALLGRLWEAGPSFRGPALRLEAALESPQPPVERRHTGTGGAGMAARVWVPPLRLAHLGGTIASRSWAGRDGSTRERPSGQLRCPAEEQSSGSGGVGRPP